MGWTGYGRGMLAAGGGYDAEGTPEYGSGIETAFYRITSQTRKQ